MPNDQHNESPATDTWVCRIPRQILHDLAANQALRHRERVLLAVVAELHSDREGGQGKTSLARLERITGIERRSVQRALGQLETDGVVVATDAKPGQMRRFRMTGYATLAHGSESAHPSDRNRAPQGAKPLRTPPSATFAHPTNEERKEGTSSRTRSRARAAEKAAETNDEGTMPFAGRPHTDTGDMAHVGNIAQQILARARDKRRAMSRPDTRPDAAADAEELPL